MAVSIAKEQGINSIGVVHDSFSSHASNVSKLNYAIRKAFVNLYSSPVLEDLYNQFQAMTDKQLPPIPKMGSLKIEQVTDSTYFAG